MPEGREQYAEKLLGAVNEAAGSVSTRFVTFLTVAAYVAVTIASTTDEMLVRSSPVTLPLLNAQIPISGPFGFYTIAPWLIALLHTDFLLQLSILGGKLSHLQQQTADLPDDQRVLLHERMANFYYIQYLTGEAQSRFLRLLAGLIIWLTAVVLPLALLLWTQARFLPFHSPMATWLHRLAIIVDALLIFFLWPQLSPRRRVRRAQAAGWRASLDRLLSVRSLAGLMCAFSVIFCLTVATIPGDERESGLWFQKRNLDLREKVLTNPLPPEVINALRDGSVEQRERELGKVSPLNFLQGRDLRHANLYSAILPKLDLRSRRDEGTLILTELSGADLRWAQMQGVLLDEGILRGAQLDGAQLQGSSLRSAQLDGANLSGARLQEAKLVNASLVGVRAAGTLLHGADLASAKLDRAHLVGADLQGANLHKAQLVDADLQGAALQGADLSEATLRGADLEGAQLQGAIMRGTVIEGANLKGANLELVDGSPQQHASKGGESARLHDYLLELACANPYVARGLVSQALHSPHRERPALATTLLGGTSRPDCQGLKMLPDWMKEALRQLVGQTVPTE